MLESAMDAYTRKALTIIIAICGVFAFLFHEHDTLARFAREVSVFTELLQHLNEGKLARTFTDDAEELAVIGQSDLLTLKKTIYVANLAENEINEPESNKHFMAVKAFEAFSLDNLLFQVLKWAASILPGFPISLHEYQ